MFVLVSHSGHKMGLVVETTSAVKWPTNIEDISDQVKITFASETWSPISSILASKALA